jgi:hypothetical protein
MILTKKKTYTQHYPQSVNKRKMFIKKTYPHTKLIISKNIDYINKIIHNIKNLLII